MFFSHSFVPLQWREIGIIPIPKPGRDPDSASSLRPISLMSCLCKIFHNMIKNRLEWFLEKSKLFSENMVGFRKGRSSLDGLVNLVSRIQMGFSKKIPTIGCFLDIDNAYINMEVTKLICVMQHYIVGERICTTCGISSTSVSLRCLLESKEMIIVLVEYWLKVTLYHHCYLT